MGFAKSLTMKKLLFLLCMLIPHFSFARENHSWNIGMYGGYTLQNRIQAVPIQNAFPFAVSLGAQWGRIWQANLIYQWTKTEQNLGSSAVLQSFRILPGIEFFSRASHHFLFEMGVGYQHANLHDVDTVGEVEWIVGPGWSWNAWENVSLQARAQYVQGFDSAFHTDSSQFAASVGISYRFENVGKIVAKKIRLDSDQDGVDDQKDQCTSTPFGIQVSANGCPQDTDDDSIIDSNDYCINTQKNAEVDEMGCPLTSVGRGVLENIEFENQSPRLTPASRQYLGEVAKNILQFPDLFYVIEGYASSQETSISQNISSARAMSVMNILISYGVPTYKIKAVGLGDQYPLVDQTQSDQRLNDRIEIKWRATP